MKSVVIALTLCLVIPCLKPVSATTAPPNLIIILTDDQGYADVGFNGCRDIPTPHIDTIVQNGVRFTNGYVSYPVCGPSRAGLLTGRYQQRFGYRTNPTVDPGDARAGIPLTEKNLAEVLKGKGYTSMVVGKWHLGSHPSQHPLVRGFDEFFGFLTGGHHYFPELLTLDNLSEVDRPWGWYHTKILHNHRRIEIDEYLTDEFSDAAVSFVKRHPRKPFFLYLSYNAPHTPLQATEKYLQRFTHIADQRRRTYAAMISAVDDGVGRLLTTLRELGIEDKTLVFFLSDNGGSLTGGSRNGSINLPLRDGKGSVYEGGIRVPFAAQWPGVLPRGLVYDHPVISLDIFATITARAGVDLDSHRPLDGIDLIPFLTGARTEAPHDTLYWDLYRKGGFALRYGLAKLVRKQSTAQTECYDLSADISEKHNRMSSIDSKRRQFLLKAYQDWQASLQQPTFPALREHDWWKK